MPRVAKSIMEHHVERGLGKIIQPVSKDRLLRLTRAGTILLSLPSRFRTRSVFAQQNNINIAYIQPECVKSHVRW